ncbi:ubiquinol--cytochrome-c reductase subunit [Saccharomycopsis crataegensis]|uniref:Ubiquinol--cytochrome-c reductase subunit n=1 Tax=Saccharomycopsis crataegensis TaxID=43959 RepID=A0AAV5QHD9_9ASCO|nr:ubiquinol--cytochrome-c reductase subunit [Saccharomycopsis crataegensis]
MFRSAAKVSGRRLLSTASAQTQYTSLANGLTVATEANPLAKSSTIGLWIGAGSKFENRYNNGVSKLTANILAESSKAAAAKEGILVGTSAERESIALYGTTLANKTSEVVELLAQQLSGPALTDALLASEKSKAIADAELIETIPKKTVLEHLHATAFQGTPLSLPIQGTPEGLANIEASDIESLLSKHAVSSNIVVVGAGNVDHEELVNLVEKKLNIKSGLAPTVKPTKFLGSDLKFRDDTLPSAYISIAVEGPAFNAPEYYTAKVASEIFGTYTSSEPISVRQGSKLANIVTENHLAQHFEHFSLGYKDTGLWGFYTETSNVSNIDDLVHFSLKQWNRLSTEITETEIVRAKNILKTKILLSMNSTVAIANDIGNKVLINDRRPSIEEIFRKIDQVSAKSVTAWAQEAVWDQDIAVTGTGQIEGLFDYNRIRNEMALLRW